MERDMIRTPSEITPTSLKTAYDKFKQRLQDLNRLDIAYREGQVGEPLPYVVNKCRLISDTKASYVAGLPVTYSIPEGDPRMDAIAELFRIQRMATHDQSVALDCSRYGRAFELAYAEADGGRAVPETALISPLDAFVAYDFSVNPQSVFGAVHYEYEDERGDTVHYLDVYDDVNVTRWEMSGDAQGGDPCRPVSDPVPHGCGRMPLTEFRNNPECVGDFVSILTLQRGINEILSDRIRDKNRFASAIMVSQGFHLGDTREEVEESMGSINGERYVAIPQDASLSYLVKTFDEASVQVLVDSINSELHTVARIPDMSDESFANDSSGEALKYKLLGLNDLAQAYVSQFQPSFRRRCKIYSFILGGGADSDVTDMEAVFTFNLPVGIASTAQTVQAYVGMGVMSRRTAMEVCPYIDDPDEEQERIDIERDGDQERQTRAELDAFKTFYPDNTPPEDAPEDEEEQ